MIILLLFGIALTALAAAFAVRAVAIGGLRRRNTLAQIAGYGFTGPLVKSPEGPPLRRAPVRQPARAGGADAAPDGGALPRPRRDVRGLPHARGRRRAGAGAAPLPPRGKPLAARAAGCSP